MKFEMLTWLEEQHENYASRRETAYKRFLAASTAAVDELCDNWFEETKKYLELRAEEKSAREEYLEAKGAADAVSKACCALVSMSDEDELKEAATA